MESQSKHRRKFGQHYTSSGIFREFILPSIQSELYNYIWVDLYAGSGNLILPILEHIPESKRINFFKNYIFLFDIQEKSIEEAISNAKLYGIPKSIAEKNIILWDSLKSFPDLLKNLPKTYPIFHITNPPYLYLGYISKHRETQSHLQYFAGVNEGYQDLYQIALMNDLRQAISRMIYIIPTNFLFGNSVSNQFRDNFLPHYKIQQAFIFEKPIFEFTGMNVGIFFFIRKIQKKKEVVEFSAIKINNKKISKKFILHPSYHYRAGTTFEEFTQNYQCRTPIKLHYYLKVQEVLDNPGDKVISVIDANKYFKNKYQRQKIYVNSELAEKIHKNILWVRTVDTGKWEGRAGLYEIYASFGISGILVTKNTYRTNPIQIFFDSPLTISDQRLLQQYVNIILEYLRTESDSEFLTSYKYSSGDYIRKYFGLSQARKIIETCPLLLMKPQEKEDFRKNLEQKDIQKILKFCKKYSQKGENNVS